MTTSTEAQLKKNSEPPVTDTDHIYLSNNHNWLPYQILGDKTVTNVQIDPQTKIRSIKLNVTL